ncbi:hypothetical protein ACW9HR_08620 [Nocardia gipuzkoensis]
MALLLPLALLLALALALPLLLLALLALPRVLLQPLARAVAVNRVDAGAGRVAGWRQLSIH